MRETGCDIWGKRGLPPVKVASRKKKTIEFISDIWGKRGATYGEKGVASSKSRFSRMRSETCRRHALNVRSIGPLIHRDTLKTEFNSEIWGKGVCGIWEKWGCLGGEMVHTLARRLGSRIISAHTHARTQEGPWFGRMPSVTRVWGKPKGEREPEPTKTREEGGGDAIF